MSRSPLFRDIHGTPTRPPDPHTAVRPADRTFPHLIDGVEQHIRGRARTDWPGPADHRHGEPDHDRFLLAPLAEAREAILRRLR